MNGKVCRHFRLSRTIEISRHYLLFGTDVSQKTVVGTPESWGIPSPYETRVISQGVKLAGPCRYLSIPF